MTGWFVWIIKMLFRTSIFQASTRLRFAKKIVNFRLLAKLCQLSWLLSNMSTKEIDMDESMYQVLKTVFKHKEFRSKLQKQATRCVLHGEHMEAEVRIAHVQMSAM